jgi:hypothetical protein
MITKSDRTLPYLKSLSSCLSKVMRDGYTHDMKIENGVIQSLQSEKTYYPHEIKVVNFFRFEGLSDPEDNAILYIIETRDGTKGTLVDAYGIYSDPEIDKFMKAVESIQKDANTNTNTNAC